MEFITQEENLLSQKARVKWLKEGDTNSIFFYIMVSARNKKRSIIHVDIEEGRVKGVLEVKVFIKRYFEESYKEDIDNRLVLTGIDFKELLVGDNVMLKKPFSLEELKEAIWDCDRDKTLGPDGFYL